MSELEIVPVATLVVPDTCIQKTEVFDAEFAKQLADNKDIVKEDRDRIRRILKVRERGNQVSVTYKLGKNIKHEFLGRWVPLQGLGLQNMPRDIRAALARKYYTDVDMVNAQSVLLSQYCKQRGWACSALDEYIENREDMLETVMTEMSVDRAEAKTKVISLLFGASSAGMPEFFAEKMHPELRKIVLNIWKENEATLKFLKKQPNNMSKGMSCILQTEERKCLEAMDRSFARLGLSMDVYIHDGGLVRNKENAPITPEMLRTVETDVKTDTGYAITLAIKPLETTFEFKEEPDDDAMFRAAKEDIEKNYFKVMDPPVYAYVQGDDFITMKMEGLIHREQNRQMANGEPMLKRWTLCPDIRTYEKIVFRPKQTVQPDEYNLFKEFAVKAQEGGDISKVMELVTLNCNRDENVVNYVLNWMAHIIQKPFKKTGSCLIFQGEEGVGKDTLWDWFGEILGRKEGYFFNTKCPENNVFNIFNHGTERSVLVKFEEAEFQTNKTNMGKLKGMLTSAFENYTRKGQDPLPLDDYRNFVMTTNNEVPILLSDTNRRFMLIKASSEKRGNNVFWEEVYDNLAKPETKSAFVHFLEKRDISNFKPQTDMVKTDYYNDVKLSQAPYHARFFADMIYRHEDALDVLEVETRPDFIEFRALELMTQMKAFVSSKFELNLNKIGAELSPYIDAGCIIKKRANAGQKYVIFPALIKKFMTEKMWFTEL
jgi:hypothetical protein